MSLPAPIHVRQLDGSAWAGSGCMGAAAAMALDAYTRGGIRVSMHAIRANQSDRSGGIGLDDVAEAWRKGWSLTLVHGSPSWATVRGRLAQGDGAIVTIRYGTLGQWRAQGSTFTGAHALYLQRLTSGPGGAAGSWVQVNDPLRSSAAVLPESVVRAAYTGGAGWGKGTYAGAGVAGPVATSCSWSAALGKRCADPLTSADLARVVEDWMRLPLLFPGTPFPFSIPNPFADLFGTKTRVAAELAPYAGRPVASLDAKYPRPGWVSAGPSLPDPTAGLVGALTNLPDTLARGGIVLGLVALAILGVALTFREPLTVAVQTAVPAGRAITAARGLARA